MSKKSNINYLRHILDTLGNLMGEDNYKESIEWLDAIQAELDVANEKLEIANRSVELYKDEAEDWEDKYNSCKQELTDLKNEEPTGLIRAGIGTIKWESDNLQLQAIMENLDQKLQSAAPNAIAAMIERL